MIINYYYTWYKIKVNYDLLICDEYNMFYNYL